MKKFVRRRDADRVRASGEFHHTFKSASRDNENVCDFLVEAARVVKILKSTGLLIVCS